MGLEKAKCPKDKNAVYVEVQKKLEGHGKLLHAKIYLSIVVKCRQATFISL